MDRNVLEEELTKEKKDEIMYLVYKIIVTVNRLKSILPLSGAEERNRQEQISQQVETKQT